MSVDIALLVLRLAFGALIFAHGAQKLFGWFGGRGLAGTRMMMERIRLRPVLFWMWTAILGEIGGGLLFALGLLDPLGALGIIGSMLMAMALTTWPRFWALQNGIEYNLLFLAPAVVEAISGPGRYSLDALLGIALPAPAAFLIGLLLVVVAVVVALATRSPAPAAAESAPAPGQSAQK